VTRKLPAGTVYATVEWSPSGWDAVKKGKITGMSMGGRAVRVRGVSPACEGEKPEMSAQDTGAGRVHLQGPEHEGQRAAAAGYSGAVAKRALDEPDDEEGVAIIIDGEEFDLEEELYEPTMEDDATDRLLALAAMGNKAARNMVSIAMGNG
jgi:hypothetical protein